MTGGLLTRRVSLRLDIIKNVCRGAEKQFPKCENAKPYKDDHGNSVAVK